MTDERTRFDENAKIYKKQVDFNQEQKNKVFLSTFLFSFRLLLLLLKEKQSVLI